MSVRRIKPSSMNKSRAAARARHRQEDRDIEKALTHNRALRDPAKRNLKRMRSLPTCPECRQMKVARNKSGTGYLCRECFRAHGCHTHLEAEKIALAAETRNAARLAGDDPGPWGTSAT